ncbi:MAG: hypothetical protein DMG15_28380 [Acidobacteria bacterium]|nr:MAG: hypothetical protein DMG15_28380 [Acidobacteriota bacterium]
MRPKINIPPGFPTSAEIVKDLHLKKSEVRAVEALLDRPLVTMAYRSAETGKYVRKVVRTAPVKKASSKTASKRTVSTHVKTKSIRQMIASKRSKSNRNR